ncbi:DUF4430 domain-containing protein [Kurthia massiliensis]|uniref:DUF4430 domain-containing protein n=1 Tax=Kurthia massiliensis TaxID=1033739 RepID=UPI000289AF05|nr:DUF4430 domain-containing protein [Kurthia massiliensis]
MKKWRSLVILSAILLSGCNVQTVSEYDKEMARLQSQNPEEETTPTVVATNENDDNVTKKEHKEKPKDPSADIEKKEKAQEKTVKETVDDQKTVETPTSDTSSELAKDRTDAQQKQSKQTTTVAPKPQATAQQQTTSTKKETSKPHDTSSRQTSKPEKTQREVSKKETKSVPKDAPKVENKTHATTTPSKPTTANHAEKKEVVTVSVRVDTLLKPEHYKRLPAALQHAKYVPKDGVIIESSTYTIEKGDSAWTATRKALQKHHVHFEYEGEGETGYGSVYVEGINHIYEKQAGSLSGWMYAVNGKAPGVGASSYDVKDGDHITWHYTTNLGRDIGLDD